MSRHKIVNKVAQVLKINDLVNLTEYKIERNKDVGEWHFYIGLLESLRNNTDKSFQGVINVLVEKKKELDELRTDPELFAMEIKFTEGYIEGCNKVLDINREFSKQPENARIICFVQDDNIKDLMTFLFEKMGFVSSYEPINGLSIWISSDVNELNMMNDTDIPTLRYIILINFKLSKIKVSKGKEARERMKNSVVKLSEYIKNEIYHNDDTFKLISMLDDRFDTAGYGYVQNPYTIEALVQEITKNMMI